MHRILRGSRHASRCRRSCSAGGQGGCFPQRCHRRGFHGNLACDPYRSVHESGQGRVRREAHEHESPVEIVPADGKEYKSVTTWKYAAGTFLQVGFEGLPLPDDVRKKLPSGGANYGGPFAIIGTEGKLVLDVNRIIWTDPPELAHVHANFQPVKEEFIGDEEANKFTNRIYRSPWRL